MDIFLTKKKREKIIKEILSFVINKDINYLNKDSLIYLKLCNFSVFNNFSKNEHGFYVGYHRVRKTFHDVGFDDTLEHLKREIISYRENSRVWYARYIKAPNSNRKFFSMVCDVINNPEIYKNNLSKRLKV